MKSLALFAIFSAMLYWADAQIGIPQIITLLDNVNDTSNTMASMLPNIANSLEVNHNQTKVILKQMKNTQTELASSLSALEADHNQTTAETTMILSQLANAQTQMARSQAQMASNQAQMASTLDQVVLILQGKK